jgi:hypothetical protein
MNLRTLFVGFLLCAAYAVNLQAGSHSEDKNCDNECKNYSIADASASFVYNHSILTFIGFLCCTDNLFKALLATFVSRAFAHEYLRLKNIPHYHTACVKEGTVADSNEDSPDTVCAKIEVRAL